jgi:broad specificity phosphatase PhoE
LTRLLLVRHGLTDAVGKLITGRLSGYPLNPAGQAEAEALADALSNRKLAAVYSSPLERALHTAARIASRHGLAVIEREALTDIEFGDWSAQAIATLETQAAFRRFNRHRAFCAIPNGERVVRVQARLVDALTDIAEAHPTSCVVVVSHGDPVRLAVAFFLGLPVDLAQRLEIGTGSVSELELFEDDVRLWSWNMRPDCTRDSSLR